MLDSNSNPIYRTFVEPEKTTLLNGLVCLPFIGIVAGITRVALGIIHTTGHLFAALVTLKKGHLAHAAKGACETLRGIIESIPIVGRIFSHTNFIFDPIKVHSGISFEHSWWMIKIYNPQKPDGLDEIMGYWSSFPRQFYAKA